MNLLKYQEYALDNSNFRLCTKNTRGKLYYRIYTKHQSHVQTYFTLRILHSTICTMEYVLGCIEEGFCTKIFFMCHGICTKSMSTRQNMHCSISSVEFALLGYFLQPLTLY